MARMVRAGVAPSAVRMAISCRRSDTSRVSVPASPTMATAKASSATAAPSSARRRLSATVSCTISSSARTGITGSRGSVSRTIARSAGAKDDVSIDDRTARNSWPAGSSFQITYIDGPVCASRPRYLMSATTPITVGFPRLRSGPGSDIGSSRPTISPGGIRPRAPSLRITTGCSRRSSPSAKSRPCSSLAPIAGR